MVHEKIIIRHIYSDEKVLQFLCTLHRLGLGLGLGIGLRLGNIYMGLTPYMRKLPKAHIGNQITVTASAAGQARTSVLYTNRMQEEAGCLTSVTQRNDRIQQHAAKRLPRVRCGNEWDAASYIVQSCIARPTQVKPVLVSLLY